MMQKNGEIALQVAITGGRGILGYRLCQKLCELGVAHMIFSGDITEADQMNDFFKHYRPTHVIHLAAVVALSRLKDEQYSFFDTNVSGTANLMAALMRYEAQPWLFYASSSHVYAPSKEPLLETDLIGPRNAYGLTKYLGEQVVSHYANSATIKTCIGRIFSLYDERQSGQYLLPAVKDRVAHVQENDSILIQSGNATRDFSHAIDIAEDIVRLMLLQAEGIFNIASGKPTTVIEFIRRSIPSFRKFTSTDDGADDIIVASVKKLRSLDRHDSKHSINHHSDLQQSQDFAQSD